MVDQKSKFECDKCKNYDGKWSGTCKAFLNGIPLPIAFGEIDHRKKIINQDNDIIFEEIKI